MSLVSRDLQRDYGMPDATPTDTLEYATRVIARLAGSAAAAVFSYPQTQSDAQQSVSELLAAFTLSTEVDCTDPGWNAVRHVGSTSISHHLSDPVPAVLQDEKIAGGAVANNVMQKIIGLVGERRLGHGKVHGRVPVRQRQQGCARHLL